MWFFQFITGVAFKWDYVIGHSIALMVWIGILPESFWATQITPKDNMLSPTAICLLFCGVDVALDLAWEGELLEMESEDKLQTVSQ